MPVHAEPVTLTVLLPFSSVYKEIGTHAKNGFLLGMQQEASELNVNPGSWITLEFLDTRADRQHALKLAREAVARGSQAILGIVSGGVALALKDYILHEAQIPYIVFGGGGVMKLRSTHPLFIRTSAQLAHASLSLALWLKDHPIVSSQKPRWACIHANYAAGVDSCDAFMLGYSQIGEEIGRVPVPFKTVNKTPQLLQLANGRR